MGVIQNSVNQALGVGALIAGKWRTDHNSSIIGAEENNVKLRKELYNKQLQTKDGELKGEEKKLQDKLNKKFENDVEKYAGVDKDGKVHKVKQFFKNSDLKRYFENQNLDRNIALGQPENSTDAVSKPPISHKEGDDPDYDPDEEKRQEAMIEEYEKEQQSIQQPSIQQVMAEQQMNKIDEMTQFKNDTKGILNLRKDFVTKRIQDLNIKPKIGYSGRHKVNPDSGWSSNRLTQAKDKAMLSKGGFPTMEGLEWAEQKMKQFEKKENK